MELPALRRSQAIISRVEAEKSGRQSSGIDVATRGVDNTHGWFGCRWVGLVRMICVENGSGVENGRGVGNGCGVVVLSGREFRQPTILSYLVVSGLVHMQYQDD